MISFKNCQLHVSLAYFQRSGLAGSSLVST